MVEIFMCVFPLLSHLIGSGQGAGERGGDLAGTPYSHILTTDATVTTLIAHANGGSDSTPKSFVLSGISMCCGMAASGWFQH